MWPTRCAMRVRFPVTLKGWLAGSGRLYNKRAVRRSASLDQSQPSDGFRWRCSNTGYATTNACAGVLRTRHAFNGSYYYDYFFI